MLKPLNYTLVAFSFLLPSFLTQAEGVENLLSTQSFTGALLTPNAQVMNEGDFSFLYGQGVPYQNKIAELDNLFFSVGLFQGLEVGGRIVTKNYGCNLYQDSSCAIRDLSASLKYQFPYVKDYTGFDFALGVQDLGGSANNFESFYAVADYEFDAYPVRLSAGYGTSEMSLGIMDGEFAAIEVQPLSFMQLVAEYDSSKVNGSVKVFTPDGLLPLNSQLALQYQLYTGHDDDIDANQAMWSVNASVPLLGFNLNQKTNEVTNHLSIEDIITVEQHHTEVSGLAELKKALLDEGFLNLNISHDKDKLYIALEDRRYNHNQIDGIGVALGIISSYAGSGLFADLGIESKEQAFSLFPLVNGIPVGEVSGSLVCYRQFIKSDKACANLTYERTDVASRYSDVAWSSEVEASSFGRTQVILAPALRYGLATEYGVWDYSLALSTNVYTTLWPGAALDIRHMLPISNSGDYEDGYFEDQQFDNEIDRAMLRQAFALPYGVTTEFSGGYLSAGNLGVRSTFPDNSSGDYDLSAYIGGVNETEWQSPTGRHAVGFQVSRFEALDDVDEFNAPIRDRSTALGHYKLFVPEFNWQFTAQAGEYGSGDVGFKATSSHWLGDVRVDASFLSSEALGRNESEEFVSLSIAVPLTFWRDMTPRYVQVRGTDEFKFTAQTRVGEDANYLNDGLGDEITSEHNLSRQYNNRDRNSQHYFETNKARLRNAYLKYLEQVK